MHRIVKICRIEDEATARHLRWMGADWIGLHLIDESYIDRVESIRQIGREFERTLGSGVVLLTKIKNIDLLLNLIATVNPTHLQLHAPWTPEELRELRSRMDATGLHRVRIIIVIDPADEGALQDAFVSKRLVDYILFDHWRGGTGRRLDESAVLRARNALLPAETILAGGLNSENVTEGLQLLNPFGVDVQSGVERGKTHKKDLLSVAKFIAVVRKYDRSSERRPVIVIPPTECIMALAVEPLESAGMDERIKSLSEYTDIFHMDHSDGSLAPNFRADCLNQVRLVAEVAPNTPYDLHLLVQLEDALATILRYHEINRLLRVAYIHVDELNIQNYASGKLGRLSEELSALGVGLGVAIGASASSRFYIRDIVASALELGIAELSVVSKGASQTISDYLTSSLPIVRALVDRSEKMTRFAVGVDRHIDLLSAKAAKECGATRFVMGRDILERLDPCATLIDYRLELCMPR